ncbi:MAG: membrane dipeptidase, partial [Phaeodactylibacter sp.]|nr:membrane dipeptidase [Phaeodactylibacter sp.]
FNKTHFNPWSINLYDEDITEILDSGGLIGLSLDQRIMGSQEVQGEFFSAEELNYILSGYKDETHEEPIASGEFSGEEERGRELNERKHLRHLCNNILHAVKVGGERAWKQMCLGSDFDGLIDPLNNCTSAEEYPKLERNLIEELPQMMREDRKHDYDESNIEGKVRDIMYNNAIDFLKKHFK